MSKLLNKKDFYYPQITFEPFPIQFKALEYLWDDVTTTILFGGSARSSKSYLASAFATISCLQYPDISIGLCRSRISYLKKTTLLTLFEFFRHQDIKEDIHYEFDRQQNIITFYNGSKILLLETYSNPSDPNFERLLSLTLHHTIIDEASETSKVAFQTLLTRLTPHPNFKNKMLIVTNPTRGYIYDEFYLPNKEGNLDEDKACVLGLPQDNLAIGEEYFKQQSKILSGAVKRRLLYGDWEYGDSTYNVFDYDSLINSFYNEVDTTGTYLSCDISDGKKDNSILIVWKGLEIIRIIKLKENTNVVEHKIRELIKQYNIPIKNISIDSDGLGVGVSNKFKGCYQFKNNSKALNKENFVNLKTQCIIKLSELIDLKKIKLLEEYKDDIIKEFQEIRYDNIERDRVQIESKEKMKKRLGYSPDIFDAILFRIIFTIKPKNKITIGG